MSTAIKHLRLPPMPKISDLIRLYGLRARKQLSQNFILDLNVTDKIARKADVFDCHVVEVGAGPGSLSRSLLKAGVQHLHAIEIDDRFLPSLELLRESANGHMTIHQGDIMKFNILSILKSGMYTNWLSNDLPNIRLVGNLPFDISIPMLLQWLQALSTRSGPFLFGRVPMTLVFQKEVGVNMMAEVYDYNRSRLSIMTQNYCHVSRPMVLRSSVFTPEPKVDAWLMHFIPHKSPAIDAPFNVIEQVVKAIFSMRRKYIRTPLRQLFPVGQEKLSDELLLQAQVSPTLKAHQLELKQIGSITEEFIKICQELNLSVEPLPINKPSLMVST